MSVFTNPASGSRAHASAYTKAVLDLLGGEDPLTVLKRTERALRRAVDGLSRKQLTQPEAPGKWSVRHVLQHLADSELVWGYRMRIVLAHDRPTLTGYDQDAFAERLDYESVDAAEALETFGVLRRSNLRLLSRASPQDLQRVGVHSERGEESVAHMMKLYAGHDLLHLNQIARIKDSLR
jgi:uncharacterized damage-inducible protein DinB